MSPRPRREERRPDLQTAIKSTAWKQIAELGAPALSLRAIARELSIAAPSIYNYFPDRDALVTALIVDAYNSLADAQEAAFASSPPDEPARQLFAMGIAYREWVVTYPQRYQLIFGTPIPNYQAPDEVTTPAAARGLAPMLAALQALFTAGGLRTERLAAMTPELQAGLSAWQAAEAGFDLEVLYLALIIWSRMHGLVGLEIGSQLPPYLADPGELFRRELGNILIQYTGVL